MRDARFDPRSPQPTPEDDVSIRPHNHHRRHSLETVTDPVCGLQISKYGPTVRRDVGSVTYHFCSDACASAFDADPARHTVRPRGPA
jgi:YHS domain-containing protein